MAILTVSQLKEHIEPNIGDAAIQRLADATEQMIVREAGQTSAVTETRNEWGFPWGRHREIYSSRPITSITSIKERDHPDDTQTTLSADDYRQEGVRRLIRLQEGTNPRQLWAPYVELIYTPESDTNIRELVQIDLVKMAIMYSGALKETEGDFSFWHHDTAKETAALLRPLRTARNNMVIT